MILLLPLFHDFVFKGVPYRNRFAFNSFSSHLHRNPEQHLETRVHRFPTSLQFWISKYRTVSKTFFNNSGNDIRAKPKKVHKSEAISKFFPFGEMPAKGQRAEYSFQYLSNSVGIFLSLLALEKRDVSKD